MTDKEEFDFQEEEGMPAAPVEAGARAEEEQLREALGASAGGRKGGRSRLLLLALLLVAVAAAAYFLLAGAPEPEPPPAPPVTEKQAIVIPPPPQPVREAVPAPPAAEEPVAKAEEAPVKTEEGAAKPVSAAEPAPAAVEVPAVSESPAGAYTVEAGAFLVEANANAAAKRLRRAGLEPRTVEGKKAVAMTRLRVGSFPPAEAEAELRNLSSLAPDAFVLRTGEERVLYAASYYDLDRARRFADQLYAQGVRVEEEPAQVEVPLFLLSCGPFADLAAAREAAGVARAAGLDALVVRTR